MTLQATRDMLAGEAGVMCFAATVQIHDGETQHWEVTDEGAMSVSVVTHQHAVPIDALLKGGGNDGKGVWFIPSVGTEVLIAFENGDFEGDAYIVGVFGHSPAGLQPGTILVLGDNIEIRSVGGTAQPLAFKSDVEAVDAKYDGHIHQESTMAPTSGPIIAGSILPNPGPPPTHLPGLPLGGITIVGTTNLKAT